MSQVNQYLNLLSKIGEGGANALFPNDFEYYVVQFELTDSQGRSIDSLVLPVNPRSLEISETLQNNVQKTAGGVVAYSNTTFNPKRINIVGTFGRSFKTLIVPQIQITDSSVESGIFGQEVGGLQRTTAHFNAQIKTGYGAMKLLESIIMKAQGLDDKNKPRRLYFYCPIFNASYLVKANNIAFDMNEDVNRIWNYSLSMMAIAPSNTRDINVLKHAQQTNINGIQKAATRVATDIHGAISDIQDLTRI